MSALIECAAQPFVFYWFVTIIILLHYFTFTASQIIRFYVFSYAYFIIKITIVNVSVIVVTFLTDK